MLRFWLNNARYNALPQSLLPTVTAIFMAIKNPAFSWAYSIIALLGVVFLHLSMNLFDDYFDYKKKGVEIRNKMSAGGIRARFDKCEYITSGKATINQLLAISILFTLLAMICGILIFLKQGWPVLVIGIIGGSLGVSYSGNPFRFSYRGFGELVIAIMFGPLLMSGVYYASCGELNPAVWFISIPIGLLVANIAYTHDIMDFDADKAVGKKTLAVLINNKKWSLIISGCFILIPYLFIIYGVLSYQLSHWLLLTLITLPQATTLIYLLMEFYKHPERKFRVRFWMQPMERWKEITEAGLEWFMIRWFLSRNLLVFFCLLIIIGMNT